MEFFCTSTQMAECSTLQVYMLKQKFNALLYMNYCLQIMLL